MRQRAFHLPEHSDEASEVNLLTTIFARTDRCAIALVLSVVDEQAVEVPEISRVVSRRVPLDSPGGIAVLVTRNGVVIHRKGYGFVRGTHLTTQSPLSLASVTKQFAAMCAAMLIEEGRLDSKAKVSRYLSGLNLGVKGRELLVQDLLWHVNGLPNFIKKEEQAAIAEFRKKRGLEFLNNRTYAEWLATREPVREPGRRFEYTNSGYVLLARIIEVVAGESFHDFQKRRILDVLGMADTTDSTRFNGSGNMKTTTAARNLVKRHFAERTTVAIFAQENPGMDLSAREALATEIDESLPHRK